MKNILAGRERLDFLGYKSRHPSGLSYWSLTDSIQRPSLRARPNRMFSPLTTVDHPAHEAVLKMYDKIRYEQLKPIHHKFGAFNGFRDCTINRYIYLERFYAEGDYTNQLYDIEKVPILVQHTLQWWIHQRLGFDPQKTIIDLRDKLLVIKEHYWRAGELLVKNFCTANFDLDDYVVVKLLTNGATTLIIAILTITFYVILFTVSWIILKLDKRFVRFFCACTVYYPMTFYFMFLIYTNELCLISAHILLYFYMLLFLVCLFVYVFFLCKELEEKEWLTIDRDIKDFNLFKEWNYWRNKISKERAEFLVWKEWKDWREKTPEQKAEILEKEKDEELIQRWIETKKQWEAYLLNKQRQNFYILYKRLDDFYEREAFLKNLTLEDKEYILAEEYKLELENSRKKEKIESNESAKN